jgi:hypothetical protein
MPGHPLSFPSDLPPLESAIQNAVQENMGMAMIFTLVTTLKEAAENLLVERAQAVQAIRDAEIRKEEEKEMEKFRGELVTKEVFERWREAFQEEMREKKEKQEKEKEEAEKSKKSAQVTQGFGWLNGRKLTGRELFEKGLVRGVEGGEDDEEGSEEELEVDKLKIET